MEIVFWHSKFELDSVLYVTCIGTRLAYAVSAHDTRAYYKLHIERYAGTLCVVGFNKFVAWSVSYLHKPPCYSSSLACACDTCAPHVHRDMSLAVKQEGGWVNRLVGRLALVACTTAACCLLQQALRSMYTRYYHICGYGELQQEVKSIVFLEIT